MAAVFRAWRFVQSASTRVASPCWCDERLVIIVRCTNAPTYLLTYLQAQQWRAPRRNLASLRVPFQGLFRAHELN